MRPGLFAVLSVPILIACFVQVAYSDFWPGPVEREVFSPSRNFKVRILPGKSSGDQFGFAGGPKGPYATAELYRKNGADNYTPIRTFTLLNPVAPVDVFLTDSGRVITFDNWHNMGYGKVVVLYDSKGSALRAYSLQELFSAEDMKRFLHSRSSIWWRKSRSFTPLELSQGKGPKLAIGQRTICVATEIEGRNVEFSLETGEFRGEQPCVPLW
jgi:hypothetical protein